MITPTHQIARWSLIAPCIAALLLILGLCGCTGDDLNAYMTEGDQHRYEHQETRDLVALVNEGTALIETEGQAAFEKLRVPNSRWRQEEKFGTKFLFQFRF